MNKRIDAIYGRQSVDRQDSISIESQIDFCKYELKGGSYKEYTDKGYSGKNTDRPRFKQLVEDIEHGLIQRVIVYKLDRISRSIIDFASMMELFQRYGVEFVSSTEKFDTSTPMGRAMLNICIVFAQLERETIQKRVTDAYYSRCRKGFHMGGPAPFGFMLEDAVIDGINTKKLIADPKTSQYVKLMYEMYSNPNTSLGDISRHFAEQGIVIGGEQLYRSTLSNTMKSPIYAQANLEVYEFFKSQGTSIINDVTDFTGINGCYLFQGREIKESKQANLKDQILVLAPHEGFIPADLWLTVRKRLMTTRSFCGNHKAKNTWLSGKIKCGVCGTGLVYAPSKNKMGYFRCRKRADSKDCIGCGTLRVKDTEQLIYNEMLGKMAEFQTLTGGNSLKANPKLTALNIELLQVEAEIEKLLDTLTGASQTLLSYANVKVENLDSRRQSITKAIADLNADTVSPERMMHISSHLDNWDNADFEDRRLVIDGLITKILATSASVQIEWKI